MAKYIKTRKKWRDSMSKDERFKIREVIRSYFGWQFTRHAIAEMDKDHIEAKEVYNTIEHGRVLEIHNCKENDVCVLMQKVIGKRAVSALVSLVTGYIVTAWTNTLEEASRTPNLENYQWDSFDATILRRVGRENLWLAKSRRDKDFS